MTIGSNTSTSGFYRPVGGASTTIAEEEGSTISHARFTIEPQPEVEDDGIHPVLYRAGAASKEPESEVTNLDEDWDVLIYDNY